MPPLRIVYFGMDGVLSRVPLAALLDARYDVCALVVARPSGMAPASRPVSTLQPPRSLHHTLVRAEPSERNAIGLAWEAGIPVLEVAQLSHRETLSALAVLQPDLICVSCFPRLLPRAVLRLPGSGALNVHPSLLPEYRGPSPLFWVFHDGLEHAGVTVHLMDEGADTGDVVAQKRLALADGSRYSQADLLCAEEGGRLLVDAVQAAATERLTRSPQAGARASYARVPSEGDYLITPAWSARRAFNFIRGIGEWGEPIAVRIADADVMVQDAVAFDEAGVLGKAVVRLGQEIRIQCSPGILTIIPKPS